jgi:MFS family permease
LTLATGADRKAAIRFIICLGVVSMFADMTYEGAHSVIGPLLSDLGSSATQVGIIAGIGEMFAASLRLFSGRLADKTRAYWTIAIFGYAINIVVVPALAFAGSWRAAALLIIAERTGKALRGPARDVLLSGATNKVGHGFGFGVHAAFDQAGAVMGPLFVAYAVAKTNHFGPAFLWLAIPAIGAFTAMVIARAINPETEVKPPKRVDQTLPPVFWTYCAAAGLLACGFVDFPLLAYHFQKTGLLGKETIPLLYAAAMGMNGMTAVIFGKLFDRFGVYALAGGILVSLLALPLGFLGGHTAAYFAVGCWGTGLGAQDASLRGGIAQVVSMNKRGTAFGAFNGIYGVMWFVGSAVMGLLYDHSLIALVVFGITAQLVASGMFVWLKRPLAAAAN